MIHDAVVSDASIVVMAVSIALTITLQLVLFLIIDFSVFEHGLNATSRMLLSTKEHKFGNCSERR